MYKGNLSNNTSRTLWIHSEVLLEPAGKQFLFFGKSKFVKKKENWLWAVSYFLRPVIIYIDEKPNDLLSEFDHKVFNSFADCRTHLMRDRRAVELVVEDPNLVCDGVSLFENSIRKYG